MTETLVQSAHTGKIVRVGCPLYSRRDLAQGIGANHAGSAFQPVRRPRDRIEIFSLANFLVGAPRGVEELALDLRERGRVAAEQLDEPVAIV